MSHIENIHRQLMSHMKISICQLMSHMQNFQTQLMSHMEIFHRQWDAGMRAPHTGTCGGTVGTRPRIPVPEWDTGMWGGPVCGAGHRLTFPM